MQLRLDDNLASDIVMPLDLVRVAAGEMKPTHRVINYIWYLMKKNKIPMFIDMFEEVNGMCEKVDVNPTLLIPVTADKDEYYGCCLR
ncbi:hypothetical protein OA416_01315 [Paracoccaceae bacterium]|nr:hypothetical protein [Paracoccaceae bacterium]